MDTIKLFVIVFTLPAARFLLACGALLPLLFSSFYSKVPAETMKNSPILASSQWSRA
jgi:hypothetical protein